MSQDSTKQVLTLSGHTERLTSTAFSPDGKLIVSASEDKTVRIWDVQSGSSTPRPFKGHTGVVNSAVFSPDGTCIASGSRDCTILIWDVQNNNVLVGPLKGHTDWVRSVAFSPEGTRVVSGSRDHTVRIWNAQNGAPIGEPLVGHSDVVFSVAFLPCGTRVVSGSRDGTIRIWDVHTGKTVVGPMEGHLDWIRSISVSSDGTRIASGSRDSTIRVWDTQTGNMVAGPFEGHCAPIFSVSFSPDGARIISGARNGTIHIWEANTGTILLFGGNNRGIFSTGFSPDGKRIVYGRGDGTAIVQAMVEQQPDEDTTETVPTPASPVSISVASHTSNKSIFEQLVQQGCTDMTPNIDANGYSEGAICGGGFGDVWKGRLIDGTEIGVKFRRFDCTSQEDSKELKRAMREVYNWSKVKHENVQELLGVVLRHERLGMVSPWMQHGSVLEYLLKHSDVNRYALCVQVATGVSYLHKEGMVHGDIKAANILVSKDGILKLSDFDLSILTQSSTMIFSHTSNLNGGSLRWMAPELSLESDDEHEPTVKRNKRTDVYALGMTFLEIITGRVPYVELSKDQKIYHALENKQPPKRPDELAADNSKEDTMWRLLMWCWDHQPASRPGADELLMMLQRLVVN